MKLHTRLLVAAIISLVALNAKADDPPSTTKAAPAASDAKLKVLFIAGGGYHDYKKLSPILIEGIKKHANVDIKLVEVKDDLNVMRDKDLGKGYDAIIYDICFAGERDKPILPPQADKELIDNALRVIKEGKPTVMLHCSMHTFMASDDWTEACGERTRVHDTKEPFEVTKADVNHPAVKHFPDTWKTPSDELYQTINFPETSTPLLKAKSPQKNQDGKVSVVCWVHTYGKGQVFSTTLGHDENTVDKDEYLRLVADGLLWACGKLDADGNPKPGYGPAK